MAEAFSKHLRVIGFDIGEKKIEKLNKTFLEKSFTKNAEETYEDNLECTTDPSKLKQADFVIIAVPTPVTKSNLMRLIYRMSNQPQKLSART